MSYDVWDLGACDSSVAPHLNDNDVVVLVNRGSSFAWSGGVLNSIVSPAGPIANAFAINDSVQVVGITDFEPFLWDLAAGPTDLSVPMRADLSGSAQDINGASVIVGCSNFGVAGSGTFPVPPIWPCIYDSTSGQLTDLRSLLGDEEQGIATRINQAGQVIGMHAASAFLYHNGTVADISHGYGTDLYAADINDAGQVVVEVSYSAAGIHDIGSGSLTWLPSQGSVSPRAINNDGTVVGSCQLTANAHPYAWISPAQGPTDDLNDLINPGSGWELQVASDINSSGHIAGIGRYRGERHAFILTPPGTNLVPHHLRRYLELLDQVIYGVVQDGGGLTKHHGPIGPWGPREALVSDAAALREMAARLDGEAGQLASRGETREAKTLARRTRELAEDILKLRRTLG